MEEEEEEELGKEGADDYEEEDGVGTDRKCAMRVHHHHHYPSTGAGVILLFFFTNTNVKFLDFESIAKGKWQDLHSFVGRILICNCQQRNVWATYEQQYTKQAPTTSYYTFGQIIQVFQSKLCTIDN